MNKKILISIAGFLIIITLIILMQNELLVYKERLLQYSNIGSELDTLEKEVFSQLENVVKKTHTIPPILKKTHPKVYKELTRLIEKDKLQKEMQPIKNKYIGFISVTIIVSILLILLISNNNGSKQVSNCQPPDFEIEKAKIDAYSQIIDKNEDIKNKLNLLKSLRDDGIITEEEYQNKRAEIISKI
ncbi:SHOCT domain-containing protein [Caloranaerobacter sp. DY30410]|uniref:SHOCT domain-containing protein n=1 Tax=Caloranaerobacter sp. DY30410 TaxID=3238305 RepID=UPI003D03FEE4